MSSRRNMMKKVGWYLMSILPVFMMIAVQFLASIIITVWYMIRYGMAAGAQMVLDNIMGVTVVTQVLTLLISGLWYYLWIVRGKKLREEEEKPHFSLRSFGSILCLAIGAQCLIGLLLVAWQYISPGQIDAYNELMESAGIGELTVLSAIATVIMAPVGEEIVCRGLTVECLKRTGAGFWVINVVQAALFGIMHLNLVQGTYAFLVGLICGYLALKYKTLIASMLFHLCFNAYSAFGTSILEKLEEMNALIYNIGVLVIGIMAFFLGIRLLKRDLRKEEKRFSGTGIGI